MSLVNNAGYDVWDADIVEPDTITLNYEYTANYSANDSAHPNNIYKSFYTQACNISGSVAGTRVRTPFDTKADGEWRVLTGSQYIGEGGPPPFFRQTFADVGYGGNSDSLMQFTISTTSTLTKTYTGPGKPPDTSVSDTADSTILLYFERILDGSDHKMHWFYQLVPQCNLEQIVSDGILEDTADVDPFTFKKGGMADFGFMHDFTNPNPVMLPFPLPNGMDVTAWDLKISATVSCA